MPQLNWEKIDDLHKRARIPGGWILKAYEDVYEDVHNGRGCGWQWRIALCFIPDPKHKWV